MKKISLGAIGGTICMKENSSGGITPALSAQDFLHSIPQISKIAQVSAHTLFAIASGHITFENLLELYHWARTEVANGAQGIVITQGTDTLEESAFFLSLIWQESVPLVFTGAMRGPEELGADGLANLYHSVLLATHPKVQGVMIVMNQIIHHPLFVQKRHSLTLDTFDSLHQEWGVILENHIEFYKPFIPLPTYPAPRNINKKVLCYAHSLDDGKELLEWAGSHYDGMILAGYGAGHTHLQARDALIAIAQKLPVILCARTYAGPSAMKTYGYKGSEMDLQQFGIIMGGYLQPKKARILLTLLLTLNLGPAEFLRFRDCIMQQSHS
ncbi:L-asparaginase [Helicobacter mustelae]|uniref:asparaginase n=1 Tax=Helicobacter mustelae TaxID=217 RepID=UPI000DFA587B|nr:asparaginase [Helicobacter mustelae]STP13335.1 L-asparaginase [Helicobacter mustelae]